MEQEAADQGPPNGANVYTMQVDLNTPAGGGPLFTLENNATNQNVGRWGFRSQPTGAHVTMLNRRDPAAPHLVDEALGSERTADEVDAVMSKVVSAAAPNETIVTLAVRNFSEKEHGKMVKELKKISAWHFVEPAQEGKLLLLVVTPGETDKAPMTRRGDTGRARLTYNPMTGLYDVQDLERGFPSDSLDSIFDELGIPSDQRAFLESTLQVAISRHYARIKASFGFYCMAGVSGDNNRTS